MSTRELLIANGSARLAVRDHGGDGSPLLLLHGYTGSAYDFLALRPRLQPIHRVVELELRGHGRSTGESWSWREAVSDIEVVVEQLRLRDAAIVGFSLGGMVAAAYAEAHPDTRAVVNVDGYGPANLGRYVPMDGETERRVDVVRAFRRSRVGRTLTREKLDAALAEAATTAEHAGRSPDDARAAVLRRLRPLSDGTWEKSPPRELATAILDAMEELDVLRLYPRIECPLLTVLAIRPDPQPRRADLSWVPELQTAHIAGLRDALRRLSAAPNLELQEVDATHGDLPSRSDVAEAILDFVARHG